MSIDQGELVIRLKDLQVGQPGRAAVIDALVQVAALDQLHDKASVGRILQAGAIHLHRPAPEPSNPLEGPSAAACKVAAPIPLRILHVVQHWAGALQAQPCCRACPVRRPEGLFPALRGRWSSPVQGALS